MPATPPTTNLTSDTITTPSPNTTARAAPNADRAHSDDIVSPPAIEQSTFDDDDAAGGGGGDDDTAAFSPFSIHNKNASQTLPIIAHNNSVDGAPSGFGSTANIIKNHHSRSMPQVVSKHSGMERPAAANQQQQHSSSNTADSLREKPLMLLPQAVRDTGLLKRNVDYTRLGSARQHRLDAARDIRARVQVFKKHAVEHCYAIVQARFKRIRRDLRMYATDRVEILQIRHLLKVVFERNYAECDRILLQGTRNLVQLQEPTTGNTVLHIAAALNDTTMMTFLLQEGGAPDLRSRRGLTPAMIAAQHGFVDMIELLAMAQADFNIADNAGRSVLFFCLQPTERHMKCLRRCVDFDADVNCRDGAGAPLLYEACEIADIIPDICCELIDSGASALTPHGTTKRTALNAACRTGCLRVCKALLDNGANPNATDQHGVAPVHEAAYVGSLECLRALSAYGANFSVQAEDGNTPLHIVAFEGHTVVCRFLVSRGCDAALKNSERFAAPQIAKHFNQKPAIKEMKKGAKIVKVLRNADQLWKVRFYDWVSCNEAELQKALQKGVHGSPVLTQSTPNKIAVDVFCQILHDLQAPLNNEQQKQTCTLLAEPGNANIIDVPQLFKAVKYMPKQAQMAAFYPKVKKQKLAKPQTNAVAELLPICQNAQPNYPLALKYKGGPIVPMVRRTVDYSRFTRDDMPEVLQDDVFWYINTPTTPYVHLSEAAKFSDLETLAEAVENKVDLDQVDKYFRSPLISAASAGALQTVMFLVKHGAHVDWPRDGFKWTALHHACRAGHLELVQYLVSQGADLKALTMNQCTPLLKAIEGGRYEIVSHLLALGVDINPTNRAGLNAARYAECFGNFDILKLIESYAVKATEAEMARTAKNGNKKDGAAAAAAGQGSAKTPDASAAPTLAGQRRAETEAAQRVAPDAAQAAGKPKAHRISSSQLGVPLLKSVPSRDIAAMQPSEFGEDDVEMRLNAHPPKFGVQDPFHMSNADEAAGIVDENDTLVVQAANLLETDLEYEGDTTFYMAQKWPGKPHLKTTEELVQDRAVRRVLDGMHVDFVDTKKSFVKNLHDKIDQNRTLIQQTMAGGKTKKA